MHLDAVPEQGGSISGSDPELMQPERERVPDVVQLDRRHASGGALPPEAVAVDLGRERVAYLVHDHQPRGTLRVVLFARAVSQRHPAHRDRREAFVEVHVALPQPHHVCPAA